MKTIGGYMFFFGAGSVVLYFLHMQFMLLAWIDMWGPLVGWAIRVALIAAGGLLWLFGDRKIAAN